MVSCCQYKGNFVADILILLTFAQRCEFLEVSTRKFELYAFNSIKIRSFLYFSEVCHEMCFPGIYSRHLTAVWSTQFLYIVYHYKDVIMGAMTSLPIIYSNVYSRHRSKKHQSSTSLAFVRGIHRWPVNSPHKRPVTWKMLHLMASSCLYALIGLAVCLQISRKLSKGWLFSLVSAWTAISSTARTHTHQLPETISALFVCCCGLILSEGFASWIRDYSLYF